MPIRKSLNKYYISKLTLFARVGLYICDKIGFLTKNIVFAIITVFLVSANPHNASSHTNLINALEKNLPQVAIAILNENGTEDIHSVTEEGKNALMLAAERGYDEVVSILHYSGEKIDKRTLRGETAIFLAAKNGHCNTVNLLLKLGADLTDVNKDGETLLITATKNGHEDVVEFLIGSNIDMEIVDSEGATALMWASFYGYREIAEILLENGAEINPQKSQSNAIMWSILGKSKLLFNLLTKELWGDSFNPNYRSETGSTMLMFAAMAKDVNMVKHLLRKGCDVNAVNYLGETAIMFVAAPQYKWMKQLDSSNAEEVMTAKILIREGAELNVQTEFGETALSYAMISGSKELITELLNNKADPNISDDHMTTPLMDVMFNGRIEIAKMLINKGASPLSVDRTNRSPLMYAILGGNLKSVEFIISEKRNIEDIEEGFGWTPLILAANLGNSQIFDVLLQNGADVNGQGKQGETALMQAAFVNNLNIVNTLLNNDDVDIEIIDNMGRTALMWAADGGSIEIVNLLLKNNANPFVVDNKQRDIIDIAIAKNNMLIANAIEEKQTELLEKLDDEQVKKYYENNRERKRGKRFKVIDQKNL